MRHGVLIPLALAAFTAMAQPATAASFPMTTRAVNEEPARAAVVASEPKDSATTPRAEGEMSLGGALYSPFALAAAVPVLRQDVRTNGHQDASWIDLTLGTLAALAGVGAFVLLMRRFRA